MRHVFHASGTYDFPFGHGKAFLNQSKIANSIVGGWTLGAIVIWQSGEPHLFTGGTQTFNGNDSGITLTGVTSAQLQHQMHARAVPGKPYVSFFDPKYINQSNGQANTAYISPASTPGQFGRLLWLHDPSNFNADLSLTKLVPIAKSINLKFQGVFLNAFNHVAWVGMDTGVQDYTFGTTSTTSENAILNSSNGGRQIELRANVMF